MTIVDFLLALGLAWALTRFIGAFRETAEIEKEVTVKAQELKQAALTMKLEIHNGWWYAWRQVDDKFMGQAPTRLECLEEVARRIGLPDPNFLIVVEEK